jgi:hypothetical protein
MEMYFLQSLIHELQESMTGVLAVSYKIGFIKILAVVSISGGPLMVAQWLRHCATNQKVAGSIPDGVIGIFPLT